MKFYDSRGLTDLIEIWEYRVNKYLVVKVRKFQGVRDTNKKNKKNKIKRETIWSALISFPFLTKQRDTPFFFCEKQRDATLNETVLCCLVKRITVQQPKQFVRVSWLFVFVHNVLYPNHIGLEYFQLCSLPGSDVLRYNFDCWWRKSEGRSGWERGLRDR